MNGSLIKMFKFFAFAGAALLVLFLAVAAKIGIYFFETTPGAHALTSREVSQSSVIYDRTAKHVLYEVYGDEDRKVIPHEGIPDTMRIATIAIEDNDFYDHKGFDIKGIARSAFVNAKANDLKQGGSTITQQLARNAFLSRERTIDRKLKELALALKMETIFSKDEILDAYLNEVSYGSNIYGIQRASEIYFRKDAKDLTLDEAATLAALTKAPSYYSPYGANKKELQERQKLVLSRIEQLGLEEKEIIERAMSRPIVIYKKQDPIAAPHFVFYVLEQIEKKYGRELLEKGGLHIITTLDLELQKKAEEIVKKGVESNARFNAENAALVAVNPQNGEILAMVGSRDYFDTAIDGQVNVADRPRQPGSSFKPIAYAKAFEKGFQPETLLFDVRTDFGPDGSGRNYVPRNYGGNFRGLVSMREALSMSLNIPAVKTLYLAGIDETVELAKRLGVESFSDGRYFGLSLVLGGGEITLLEGVSAYSVFANDGIRAPSTPVIKITRAEDGRELEFNQSKSGQVISPEVARKISSILSDNAARAPVFGSSNSLVIPGFTVAAKTGTTQEYRDAWTIGYTPKIAAGVWAGNNDNRPMKFGADGSFVAAPIWNQFMRAAREHYGLEDEKFIPYQKVQSNKKMVTGNPEEGRVVFINTKTGKEISKSKAEKTDPEKVEAKFSGARHSILFHANKNDPLGTTPPDFNDPMLARWEASLHRRLE